MLRSPARKMSPNPKTIDKPKVGKVGIMITTGRRNTPTNLSADSTMYPVTRTWTMSITVSKTTKRAVVFQVNKLPR